MGAPNAEIAAIAQAGYQNEGIEVGEAYASTPNMKVVIVSMTLAFWVFTSHSCSW